MSTTAILTKEELLQHWLGHRNLTRKTIEKFPEQELFAFSIGGMRTFADQVKEMILLAEPSLQEIVSQKHGTFNHDLPLHTKADLLRQWDADTPKIVDLYHQIPEESFHDAFKLFGQYDGIVLSHIQYFIENEVHHRSQGFVYLRALGIEPPFFWDRF